VWWRAYLDRDALGDALADWRPPETRELKLTSTADGQVTLEAAA